jgi:hypothetical protein
MRVLFPLNWLFFYLLTNGKVHDPLGELVHVARAHGACFHAFEYGAARLPLQTRSSRSLKLSHYPVFCLIYGSQAV